MYRFHTPKWRSQGLDEADKPCSWPSLCFGFKVFISFWGFSRTSCGFYYNVSINKSNVQRSWIWRSTCGSMFSLTWFCPRNNAQGPGKRCSALGSLLPLTRCLGYVPANRWTWVLVVWRKREGKGKGGRVGGRESERETVGQGERGTEREEEKKSMRERERKIDSERESERNSERERETVRESQKDTVRERLL